MAMTPASAMAPTEPPMSPMSEESASESGGYCIKIEVHGDGTFTVSGKRWQQTVEHGSQADRLCMKNCRV